MKIVPTALGLCLAAAALPAAAQTITVAWRDKPPYHYLEDGVEKGELLLRARAIFAAAGIPTHFVREPSKRIWANFGAGRRHYCSIGWYRLPERELVAQFSIPFHADPPHAVLVAPDAVAAVAAHPTLASLLADRQLVMGVVDGVSYGPELDALIASSANQVQRRTVDPAALMRMILAGRFAFMFADVDDWDYWRVREPPLGRIVPRQFPDMPPGQQRYIACGKDVAPGLMARLNKAIEQAPEAGAGKGPRR